MICIKQEKEINRQDLILAECSPSTIECFDVFELSTNNQDVIEQCRLDQLSNLIYNEYIHSQSERIFQDKEYILYMSNVLLPFVK